MQLCAPNHDIVVMIPDEFELAISDTRLHLLFMSISELEPNYHLYIVGTNIELISVLALLYINPLRLTELPSLNSILNNPHIKKVLRLEPGLFINNLYDLRNSPVYIDKHELHAPYLSDDVPCASALLPSSIEIMKVGSQFLSDVYMHFRPHEHNIISRITGGDEIRISCLLIVNTNNQADLYRCMECYHNQTHSNKELILVAPSHLDELITEYLNSMPEDHHILWVHSSDSSVEACTGDYIIRWNLSDWYHPALLSILADRTNNTMHDYLSLEKILGHNHDKFVMSESNIQGWKEIIMIRRDKLLIIPDVNSWYNTQMKLQWTHCDSICIIEEGYESLYINMNYVHAGTEVSLLMQEYYAAIILGTTTPVLNTLAHRFMSSVYSRMLTYWQSTSDNI